MFRSLTITSKLGSLEIGHNFPYILQRIDGLGVPESVSQITKNANRDGATYGQATFSPRIINLEFGIITNSRTEQFKLREYVNRVLTPKYDLNILYEYPGGKKTISGRLSGVLSMPEAGVSGYQKVLCAIECPDPYWQDVSGISQEIANWRGAFEFPLIIPEDEGIEMGVRLSNLVATIDNKGGVATGMRVVFKATGTVEKPSLFNIQTREFIKIKKTLNAGEELIVTTSLGNKRVYLKKDNVITNGFVWLDDRSSFMQLEIGKNIFRYDAEKGIDNLEMVISYTQQYAGV